MIKSFGAAIKASIETESSWLFDFLYFDNEDLIQSPIFPPFKIRIDNSSFLAQMDKVFINLKFVVIFVSGFEITEIILFNKSVLINFVNKLGLDLKFLIILEMANHELFKA